MLLLFVFKFGLLIARKLAVGGLVNRTRSNGIIIDVDDADDDVDVDDNNVDDLSIKL